MQKEQLNVKVTLSGTYWDRKPEYMVSLGDVDVKGEITGYSGEHQVVELTAELEDEQEHTLYIYLLNKTDTDTVENEDKTQIIKDMLLNIVDVTIDGISIGQMMWTRSEYLTTAFEEPVRGCVNMGWNGKWCLKFKSPFYIWFLENS